MFFLIAQCAQTDHLSLLHTMPQSRRKHVRIICKTEMNGGFCYMAIDEKELRLLRPIRDASNWPPSWCLSIPVGSLIECQVLHHPDETENAQTSFPHKNEDMIVTPCITVIPEAVIKIPRIPKKMCKQHVFQIFPEKFIRDNRYVVENVNSPSAGILKVEQKNVQVYTNVWGKCRVNIRYRRKRTDYMFDFPITAVQIDQPQEKGYCLVILGLSRPFAGNFQGFVPFCPRRCYILVIGIINLPL